MHPLRSEIGLLLLGACVSLSAIACATGKQSQDPSPRVEKLLERPNKPTTIRIDGKEVAIEDVTKAQADLLVQEADYFPISEDSAVVMARAFANAEAVGASQVSVTTRAGRFLTWEAAQVTAVRLSGVAVAGGTMDTGEPLVRSFISEIEVDNETGLVSRFWVSTKSLDLTLGVYGSAAFTPELDTTEVILRRTTVAPTMQLSDVLGQALYCLQIDRADILRADYGLVTTEYPRRYVGDETEPIRPPGPGWIISSYRIGSSGSVDLLTYCVCDDPTGRRFIGESRIYPK